MFSEFIANLSQWGSLDTWIAVSAALTAMACALPGNFLVLRRQSMLGDALSHSVLLGIVVAFIVTHRIWFGDWFAVQGWGLTYHGFQHAGIFAAAVFVGVATAWLTELVQKLGRVESSAALGVVYTTLFALALLLVRVAADQVHVDADCVFYGLIETAVMDTYGQTGVPVVALTNGGILLVNLVLVTLFFKELRICAFDPNLATAQGINARAMHYALMGVTAVTLVAAFENVGAILVIAMLIVPASTARLLTDRLWKMIAGSLIVAGLSAVLGHVLAITLPSIIFRRLGFETVVDASTPGMIALASGLIFLAALFFSPRQGLISKGAHRALLSIRIAGEDLLGVLYRLEERGFTGETRNIPEAIEHARGLGPVLCWLAVRRLRSGGQITVERSGYRLTEAGRDVAKRLVRSHRLWESYLAKHFALPDDRLHAAAHQVEHYLGPEMRDELSAELAQPRRDPHGSVIPPEGDSNSPQ